MRSFTFKLITVLSTFLIGVGAAGLYLPREASHETGAILPESSSNLRPAEMPLEPIIYPATLCELVRYPSFYDRKLVRLQTTYESGIDSAGLVGTCDGKRIWLAATCALETEDKAVEAKSGDKLSKIVDGLWEGGVYPSEVSMDVEGRFYAHGGGGDYPWFAMLNVIDAKPAKRHR